MNTVPTIEWLASYDSVEAFPKLEWSATYSRLQRAMARLTRCSGVAFKLEDPSGYQDGAMLTRAWEPTAGSRSAKHSLSGYEFSKFGSLFTGGRGDGSAAPADVWNEMTGILSSDYGFTFVPESLLSVSYEGIFVNYGCRTWDERFFSAFYTRPTKPSTRRAKAHAREG
jgi:hypothetical protein